jgi:hypothetical protein
MRFLLHDKIRIFPNKGGDSVVMMKKKGQAGTAFIEKFPSACP